MLNIFSIAFFDFQRPVKGPLNSRGKVFTLTPQKRLTGHCERSEVAFSKKFSRTRRAGLFRPVAVPGCK